MPTLRTATEPLRLLWQFFKSPATQLAGFDSRRQQFLFYAHLMGLSLLIQFIWVAATAGLRARTGMAHEGFGAPGLGLYLGIALLVPVYEELLFRSWLKYPAWLIVVALVLIVKSWGLSVTDTVQVTSYLVLLVAILAGKKLKRRLAKGQIALRRMLPWTVPLSTLAFAFAHISNWSGHAGGAWMLPLMVLPQLLSGAVFAYARVRSGLHVSIALHVTLNALAFGLTWLSASLGGDVSGTLRSS